MFFIDCVNDFKNNYGCYVTRLSGGDWNWSATGTNGIQFRYLGDVSYANNFKTIAIMKKGSDVYFFSDGKMIFHSAMLFDADEKLSVNVMEFNLQVRLKNAVQITDENELKAKMEVLGVAERNTQITVDGNLSDWTETQKSGATKLYASDNRSVTVYAHKNTDGVYIGYDVIQNAVANTSANWWENTNAEFQIGNSGQLWVNVRGWSNLCGDFVFKDTIESGKQHFTVEMFFPYGLLDGVSAGSDIEAGFAFKTAGETGNVLDGKNDYWFIWDNSPSDRFLKITANGINAAADLTIDGNKSDWNADVLATEKTAYSDENKTVKVVSYMGSDGVYTFVTVTAKTTHINACSINWSENTNIELQLGGNTWTGKAIIFGNAAMRTGTIGRLGYTESEADGVYTLNFEMYTDYKYIKDVDASSAGCTVKVGCVIDGWTTLACWDNPYTATKNGLSA